MCVDVLMACGWWCVFVMVCFVVWWFVLFECVVVLGVSVCLRWCDVVLYNSMLCDALRCDVMWVCSIVLC